MKYFRGLALSKLRSVERISQLVESLIYFSKARTLSITEYAAEYHVYIFQIVPNIERRKS
jgi:hypothetical protein